MNEIITIGSSTQDIFISSNCSEIINVKGMFQERELLCLGHGDKIEVEDPVFDIGGGAINTAANFKNLGFDVASIVKTGDDIVSKAILNRLKEKGIDYSMMITDPDYKTGFSIILTSFEGDRTVLTHRGANGKIEESDIPWERIKEAKWIYIAPLSNESNLIVEKVVKFAKKFNVKVAYNPGGTALKTGLGNLKEAISNTDVLLMNKDEASKITGVDVIPNCTCNIEIQKDIFEMFQRLNKACSGIILITNGKNGAIAYDQEKYYKVPIFPSKQVVTTLGAGDAFSSTFVATLLKNNGDIKLALQFAAINSSSVIEKVGAQVGFKKFDEIHKTLEANPSFKVEEICA